MTDIIVLSLFKKGWLGIKPFSINQDVKEIFAKRLVIRWQRIPKNRILLEVKRND